MGEQVHERKIFSVCLLQRPLNNRVLLASKGLRRAMIYPITLGEKSRCQNLRKVISCTHVAKPTGIRGRTCDYYYTTRNRTKWNTIRSVIKWLSKSKRESDLSIHEYAYEQRIGRRDVLLSSSHNHYNFPKGKRFCFKYDKIWLLQLPKNIENKMISSCNLPITQSDYNFLD